jgi:hypothetical protein
LSLAMMSLGVPLGAKSPSQADQRNRTVARGDAADKAARAEAESSGLGPSSKKALRFNGAANIPATTFWLAISALRRTRRLSPVRPRQRQAHPLRAAFTRSGLSGKAVMRAPVAT